jgi:hypothetical protein
VTTRTQPAPQCTWLSPHAAPSLHPACTQPAPSLHPGCTQATCLCLAGARGAPLHLCEPRADQAARHRARRPELPLRRPHLQGSDLLTYLPYLLTCLLACLLTLLTCLLASLLYLLACLLTLLTCLRACLLTYLPTYLTLLAPKLRNRSSNGGGGDEGEGGEAWREGLDELSGGQNTLLNVRHVVRRSLGK